MSGLSWIVGCPAGGEELLGIENIPCTMHTQTHTHTRIGYSNHYHVSSQGETKRAAHLGHKHSSICLLLHFKNLKKKIRWQGRWKWDRCYETSHEMITVEGGYMGREVIILLCLLLYMLKVFRKKKWKGKMKRKKKNNPQEWVKVLLHHWTHAESGGGWGMG